MEKSESNSGKEYTVDSRTSSEKKVPSMWIPPLIQNGKIVRSGYLIPHRTFTQDKNRRS